MEKKIINKSLDAKKPRQSLLFLHGFRQSSNKLKKRVTKLLNHLKLECNTSVTFLNGTHPYKPNGEVAEQTKQTLGDLALNPIESQRVWFNSDDNAEVYSGIDEALHHILVHVKSHPPYDGIIGFGQGATLAAIFTRLNPNLFRYIIAISAFQPRSIKHASLFSSDNKFDLPSLHIFGKNDILINPSRSESFAKCFNNSVVSTHSAGHFAPDSWSLNQIVQFIAQQSNSLKPAVFTTTQSLENKINELNFASLRFNLNDLDLTSLIQTSIGLSLYTSEQFKNFNAENFTKLKDSFLQNLDDVKVLEDKLILIYLLLSNITDDENNEKLKIVLQLWIDIYLNETQLNDYLIDSIEYLFINTEKYRELVILCSLAYMEENPDPKLTFLYDHLIVKFFDQLAFDLSLVDKCQSSYHLQGLTSFHKLDPDLREFEEKVKNKLNLMNKDCDENQIDMSNFVSNLAKYLPRVKSSIDRKARVAREIANLLNDHKTSNDEVAKILSYNHYRKILSIITRFKDTKQKSFSLNSNPREFMFLARYNKSAMKLLMSAPLSDAILNPVPEPVDISSRDQLQPLYSWLKLNQIFNENDYRFLKGTVTTDGRLDLCKQVIGPQGIQPLLDSMENSKQVNRVLLGNNIIGDLGGKIIADFIKSGKSTIKIWYIAGNQFTSIGIEPICDALLDDKLVNALWLKRNPLKAQGMYSIGRLLRFNTTIQTLDLLNCGLLDSGVEILFASLNENQTLKHLYLSANGITPFGISYIRDYFKNGTSRIETLFLGANRIGDEGAKIITDFFEYENKLERVNLASSRIGAEGMRWLSVAKLDKLKVLDIGYMRSTMDLGELGNFIEDQGAEYLSDFLRNSKSLVSLNITHNHITQKGLQKIVNSLKLNESLLYLDYIQFGVSLNEITLTCLRNLLERNRKKFLDKFDENYLESIVIPEHVKEIYSVYRTH